MVCTKLGWFIWFLNVRNITPLENCVNILRSKKGHKFKFWIYPCSVFWRQAGRDYLRSEINTSRDENLLEMIITSSSVHFRREMQFPCSLVSGQTIMGWSSTVHEQKGKTLVCSLGTTGGYGSHLSCCKAAHGWRSLLELHVSVVPWTLNNVSSSSPCRNPSPWAGWGGWDGWAWQLQEDLLHYN